MRTVRRLVLVAGALPLMLTGCVAALVPVVAGGLVAREQIGGRNDTAAAPATEATVGREAAVLAPAGELPPVSAAAYAAPTLPPLPEPDLRTPAQRQGSAAPRRGEHARLERGLSELPPPAAATGAAAIAANPFEAFARYAGDHAAPPPPGRARNSALIDPRSLVGTPQPGKCTVQPPAVVLDLDPGGGTFDLGNPPLPAAGLADALAGLRLAGLTVLWVSRLPEAEAARLGTVLQATGLDPDGEDRLVLLREANDRKATRLQQEARRYCVIAFAADQRGDFEEAFDYLRNPDGPVAEALESHIGAGWFLTPNPID